MDDRLEALKDRIENLQVIMRLLVMQFGRPDPDGKTFVVDVKDSKLPKRNRIAWGINADKTGIYVTSLDDDAADKFEWESKEDV